MESISYMRLVKYYVNFAGRIMYRRLRRPSGSKRIRPKQPSPSYIQKTVEQDYNSNTPLPASRLYSKCWPPLVLPDVHLPFFVTWLLFLRGLLFQLVHQTQSWVRLVRDTNRIMLADFR